MKTIWVIQYNDGTADVFDSEQGAPALPYNDAFEVQERIAELEKALATLMDEYLCQNGFDTHYYAAAAVLTSREKEEK